MSLWEERKFLETDPDYLWRYAHQRKASQGHALVYAEYTLHLLQVQRTSTDTQTESYQIMHCKMKSPRNEVQKSSQILYKDFQKYERLCSSLLKNLANLINPLNYTH